MKDKTERKEFLFVGPLMSNCNVSYGTGTWYSSTVGHWWWFFKKRRKQSFFLPNNNDERSVVYCHEFQRPPPRGRKKERRGGGGKWMNNGSRHFFNSNLAMARDIPMTSHFYRTVSCSMLACGMNCIFNKKFLPSFPYLGNYPCSVPLEQGTNVVYRDFQKIMQINRRSWNILLSV